MEGPQTKALADYLHALLTGSAVERLDVPEHRWQANMMLLNCVGQVIQRVNSHGKWLIFDFSHGVTWMCHPLAKSTWKVREPQTASPLRLAGDALEDPKRRRPGKPPLIHLVLRNRTEARLIGRPLFYILPTATIWRHAEFQPLGPDPLSAHFVAEYFLARLRAATGRPLAAALLDQTIVAGIGNQMKCEILFEAKLAPATRISDLFSSEMDALGGAVVRTMKRFYQFHASQLEGGRENRSFAVYDRAGEPCIECGGAIEVDRSAGDGHFTWYCPACQSGGHTARPGLFDAPQGP